MKNKTVLAYLIELGKWLDRLPPWAKNIAVVLKLGLVLLGALYVVSPLDFWPTPLPGSDIDDAAISGTIGSFLMFLQFVEAMGSLYRPKPKESPKKTTKRLK